MSVRTLNARLTIADALKHFDNKPETVPITNELLLLAGQARRHYQDYLDAEKLKEKERIQQKEKEKAEKRLAAEQQALVKESKKTLQEIDETMVQEKEIKTQKEKSADKLLEEGNIRLKAALAANNTLEARIAQALIDGALIFRTFKNCHISYCRF